MTEENNLLRYKVELLLDMVSLCGCHLSVCNCGIAEGRAMRGSELDI